MARFGFAILALSYLIGTFPSGYVAGLIAGVDVRKEGSGNVGATNVSRILGKRFGYPVFFADAFKGFAAVRLAFFIMSYAKIPREFVEPIAILAAVTCVVGHAFPIWFGFKGGKGVATSAGVIFGLMPIAALTIFVVWVVVFETTRYVSVASIAASVALPITVAFLLWFKITEGVVLLYFAIAMAVLVIWRHRSNFARLRNGTEQRFDRK